MGMEVKVQVARETYELGKGISDFVAALAVAVKDGWQFGSDLPDVVQAVIRDLVPALQGVEKIKGELALSKKEVAYGVLLPVVDAVEKLLK